MDVRGRDMVTGLPKTISLTSSETLEALSEPVQAIVQCVKGVLERTPPELAADIIDKGIVLTGEAPWSMDWTSCSAKRLGYRCTFPKMPPQR